MKSEIYKRVYIYIYMSVWMKLKDNYIRDLRRWNLNFTLCLWNIYIYFCILTPYPIINRSKHKLGGGSNISLVYFHALSVMGK